MIDGHSHFSVTTMNLNENKLRLEKYKNKLNDKAIQLSLHKSKLSFLTHFKTVIHFLRNIQLYLLIFVGYKNSRIYIYSFPISIALQLKSTISALKVDVSNSVLISNLFAISIFVWSSPFLACFTT